MNPPNPWIPFFTTALLGILSLVSVLVSAYLGHRFGLERESRSKAIEVGMRRRQRLEEFEEKFLIAFQDGMADIAKKTYGIAKKSTLMVTKELDLEYMDEFLSTHTYNFDDFDIFFNNISRLSNDKIRNLGFDFYKAVLEVRSECIDLIESRMQGKPLSLANIGKSNRNMIDIYTITSDAIGEWIRSEIKSERSKVETELSAEQFRRENSLGNRVRKQGRRLLDRYRKAFADMG